MEYYDRVAENFLELASSQRLHILFKLMERSRKRIEPIAKELDATKQEIHRNLVRLEQSGLITKDKEGKYALTTFGLFKVIFATPWVFVYRTVWKSEEGIIHP